MLAVNSTGHIFAGSFTEGLFRSTDNGENWSPISNGLGSLQLGALAFADNGTIFAGTFNGGVFRSMDNGDSWNEMNNGLTNPHARSFVINSSGVIFTGTDGSGVYRSTDNGESWHQINEGLKITTSVEQTTELPSTFRLEQNYPNPFNPSTTIEFALAEGSDVTLKVFDLTGKEVAILVNETLAPGTYKVTFEANKLPSAIYFYRIEADGFSQIKKLMLLK